MLRATTLTQEKYITLITPTFEPLANCCFDQTCTLAVFHIPKAFWEHKLGTLIPSIASFAIALQGKRQANFGQCSSVTDIQLTDWLSHDKRRHTWAVCRFLSWVGLSQAFLSEACSWDVLNSICLPYLDHTRKGDHSTCRLVDSYGLVVKGLAN